MTSFYVTTPIYYVNDVPHLGHIFTTTAADTLARYRRLKGDAVYFLTGTDEHGQNIERAAKKEGVAPIELADRVVSRYFELRDRLGFSNDDFIRTTQERHHKGVQEIIRRLEDAGDLYAARHEGWYCSPCETFYTEKELGPDKTCPVHGTPVEWKSEENVFFRLSKYQQRLLDWYDSDQEPVRPASRRNEVRSFVESGLRDLSVSRANLEWGIPFPGYPGQTVYVWLDALTNYISALGFGTGDGPLYKKFWQEGDVRLNLIGKDIIRHHAVYWPAFLMSAGLPLPTTVFAHGWWNRDGKKMSKSTGNIVRPDDLIDRFGADPVRYFLLREMVFGQDASYSDEAFIERYNADLANTLGNTVSRVVTLSRGAFGGKTPPVPCEDNPILEAARRLVPEYRTAMDELAFSRALEALWKLLNEASQYLVTREPWKVVKEEGPTEKLSRILWNGLEAVRIVATGLLPFMPKIAPQILAAIGVAKVPASLTAMEWGGTPNSVELPEPSPIFPRIDKKEYLGAAKAPEPATKPARSEKPVIAIDKFFETELKVGTIQTAERVPKSEKLIKMSVDVGEETPRQIVAGIGLAYQPEELVGKQVAVVANLQPAKLMGIESQGMVLAASIDGKPVLLHPDKQVPAGTQVK
ncbi:MAG TPA: methionine--tRNA ligase [Thermoanaerobaculia bacterium]|nr:methionine--tRNA ligase [Thermoanaerobaculia bacterium]